MTPPRPRACCPPGVEPVVGDVTDPASLERAVEGCEIVFNAMGLPEQWVRDESIFDRVNAEGTRSLADAARRAGVRRLVHTSTHDVFHAERGARFDESRVADYPKGTAYERSKQRAEELALAARDGLEVVIVNPSGVYGPGPSASVSFDKGMFEPLVKRRLPALPPGGLGLVFTEGLAAGHLLAGDRGPRRRALHPVRHIHVAARPCKDGRPVRRAVAGCLPRCRPGAAPARWRRQRGAVTVDRAPAVALTRPALLLHLERGARLDEGADGAGLRRRDSRTAPAHARREVGLGAHGPEVVRCSLRRLERQDQRRHEHDEIPKPTRTSIRTGDPARRSRSRRRTA